jgi:hypothetical protein
MLAGVRRHLPLFLILALFVFESLPLAAQINGVPASVSSIGLGGRTNPVPGVRASVTSLGPHGYANGWAAFGNCCTNFFLPANQNPQLFPDHRHLRKDRTSDRHRDHSDLAVGLEPVYIPYPVQDTAEADDDSSDVDYVHAPGMQSAGFSGRHAASRDGFAEGGQTEPEPPVAVQPTTVLIYKDGHKLDVVNYAIVGDTLFDFAEGRSRKISLAELDLPATRKANDDRGVDFQIPATRARQ